MSTSRHAADGTPDPVGRVGVDQEIAPLREGAKHLIASTSPASAAYGRAILAWDDAIQGLNGVEHTLPAVAAAVQVWRDADQELGRAARAFTTHMKSLL